MQHEDDWLTGAGLLRLPPRISEQLRDTFQQPFLPGRDMTRVDAKLRRQLSRRLVTANGRQRHLRLERCSQRPTFSGHGLNILKRTSIAEFYPLSGCPVFGVHYSQRTLPESLRTVSRDDSGEAQPGSLGPANLPRPERRVRPRPQLHRRQAVRPAFAWQPNAAVSPDGVLTRHTFSPAFTIGSKSSYRRHSPAAGSRLSRTPKITKHF